MSKRPHSRLWLYLAGVIFITIVSVFLIVAVCWLVLFELELIGMDPRTRHVPIMVFCLSSILLGSVMAVFVGEYILQPVQRIGDAFDELSKGNFSVQVSDHERIEEIREIARHFNAMVHDLAHMETLRSDFVTSVSHEFKTPIAAIEGYATLLQNPGLTREKHDHYVEIILDNSRRLSELSSNILTLSRLENQELIVDKREFRLDEQIRKVILMLESRWAPKDLSFDLLLPRQMYVGSESMLSQVWSNLLDNAIKHSPDGGVIRVTLEQREDQVTVVIADCGEGMSEEVQKHIFEKFYQGDPSRKSEGNGLGLALVKRIAELSCGTVSVESAPGQGAAFTVTLPL